MVKGCQKTVIYLKNTGSEYFDEAYFVLTDDIYDCTDGDLIAEANRIIESAGTEVQRKRRLITKEKIISFTLGLLISLTLSAVLYILP